MLSPLQFNLPFWFPVYCHKPCWFVYRVWLRPRYPYWLHFYWFTVHCHKPCWLVHRVFDFVLVVLISFPLVSGALPKPLHEFAGVDLRPRHRTTCLWTSGCPSVSFVRSVVTTKVSIKRRGRRNRAIAKRRLWLFRQGWIVLTSRQLKRIRQLLTQHHSKDPSITQFIDTMETKAPWKCLPCKRLNKSTTAYCGMCGCYWDQCWDKDYVHGGQRSYSQKDWRQWNWAIDSSNSQRPQSPRRRALSPRQIKGGKGGGKTKQKTAVTPPHKWPAPVLDYSRIQDSTSMEQPPARTTTVPKAPESTAEVQDLIAPMDLKRHIGQLTKVKKGIGCTPGSSLQAQGCLETSCREARSEHEGTIATVPEGHAGLRCLRGRPDAAVPKRQSCNPTDHPTEQTCRRRPTSLERCGFRTPSRYINSSHRNRRPGERRSRSGDDGGGKSTRDSVYLVRMCGIAYTRKGTIQVSWTTDRHGSWQQAKFMRRRCGMTPTQQSVYTERDRPRNLRFSTCVGFLESSYVGTAASDLPSHQNTYGWMILEEPKLPAGTNPRRCMDTETACRHSLVHSIRQVHDFTNPWEAIGKAFLLHLDVSSTFSTPFHLDHDAVWDFNTGLDDSIPCRNRPNEQTQSSEPLGFAHGPAPAEGTSMRLEVDQLRRRPLPYAFAAAENHAAQDTIVEEHIGEKIVIVSYGFKHYYLEQRTLHVDFTQRASWRQLLRAQWADHDDGLFFALHSVKPPSVIHRSTVAVVVQLSPLPEVQALCLLQFVPHQGLPEPAFVTPVPVRAMRSTVFQACGQHLTAESSAVIKQGHKLWPRGEVQIIGHGTFLRILIDVESDETTMSQLGEPTLLSKPLPLTCRPKLASLWISMTSFHYLMADVSFHRPIGMNSHCCALQLTVVQSIETVSTFLLWTAAPGYYHMVHEVIHNPETYASVHNSLSISRRGLGIYGETWSYLEQPFDSSMLGRPPHKGEDIPTSFWRWTDQLLTTPDPSCCRSNRSLHRGSVQNFHGSRFSVRMLWPSVHQPSKPAGMCTPQPTCTSCWPCKRMVAIWPTTACCAWCLYPYMVGFSMECGPRSYPATESRPACSSHSHRWCRGGGQFIDATTGLDDYVTMSFFTSWSFDQWCLCGPRRNKFHAKWGGIYHTIWPDARQICCAHLCPQNMAQSLRHGVYGGFTGSNRGPMELAHKWWFECGCFAPNPLPTALGCRWRYGCVHRGTCRRCSA